MSARKFGYAFVVGTLLLCGAGQVVTDANADDKAAQAQQAIANAETELSAAAAAGHVWQLIDKATGSSSVSLDDLLATAMEKDKAGEYDEAIRIANRVADAAMMGVEQAETYKGSEPFYN